jgi:hypothetical protein
MQQKDTAAAVFITLIGGQAYISPPLDGYYTPAILSVLHEGKAQLGGLLR